MFDDDASAETQMSEAFGCIVITVIAIGAAIIVGAYFLIKSLV